MSVTRNDKEGIRPYGPEHARQVIASAQSHVPERPADRDRKRRAAIDDFFSRSIFEDPWRHDDLPSLVYKPPTGT